LLRQLLLNLVANALNASPPAGLVTLESSRVSGGWRFVVVDEGPGVPHNQLEQIFERFVRCHPLSGAGVGSGHGLGLAICRGIVELHGGKIRAANRLDGGGGLRVEVELPA
jgi:two-component system heavy metal sensor histidine kinase CusS